MIKLLKPEFTPVKFVILKNNEIAKKKRFFDFPSDFTNIH